MSGDIQARISSPIPDTSMRSDTGSDLVSLGSEKVGEISLMKGSIDGY